VPSVTNLSLVLTVDQKQYEVALGKAAERVQQFGQKAERAMAQSTHGAKRTGMMFQEAGRGVEDFLVSFQTGGLAGGLRGVTNNLGQLGSMLSPMAGGWLAIGGAVAAVTIPAIMKYIAATEDASVVTERLKKANDLFTDSLKRRIDMRDRLRDAGRMEASSGNRRCAPG
jgi:hypothetical protein